MSLTLESLLAKGYFPRELPPPFRTVTFARFASRIPNPFPNAPKKTSKPEIFNLARAGTLRRPLSIINPIQYFRLAAYIASNWTDLKAESSRSKLSLSSPVPGRDRRALGRRVTFEELMSRRASVRGRGRFLLRADISRFYQSIYTHSIAWAIHTKAWAKGNRGRPCLGNDLDSLLQRCQDGQTNGIPIGPDISLLIAEILLSKVDEKLVVRSALGLRYIDDYEIVFNSESEAYSSLSIIQQALLEDELHLNASKTKIFSLPQPTEDHWATVLKGLSLNPAGRQFKGQVIRFFDTAFALASDFPQDGVLKYAVGRIANIPILSDLGLVEDCLYQCARAEPGCLSTVLRILIQKLASSSGKVGSRSSLLLDAIRTHAPQRHSSEVSWALWGCLALRIRIPRGVLPLVVLMEDSVCALLACHAKSMGLVERASELDPLKASLTTSELYQSRWLLAYEASVKGWLSTGVDHIASDSNFLALRNGGACFYDTTKLSFPIQRRRQSLSSTRDSLFSSEPIIGGAPFTQF